ncbi:hypothetical protein [Actinomadura sp. 21ATH]|uniref:hypothetical protein n=1 Tax=Actinomadura sp. 21ATH TaxID=1735444 RepID=UPI0035BF5EDC
MGELELYAPQLVERARRELARQQAAELVAVGQQAALELIAQGRVSLTMVEPTNFVAARVQAGEWIADCPAPDCQNAEFVSEKDPRRRGVAGSRWLPFLEFVCTVCGARCPIQWPADAEEIIAVLDRRPNPMTRNWWPAGAKLAVLTGTPTGQTVADLLAENAEHGVR